MFLPAAKLLSSRMLFSVEAQKWEFPGRRFRGLSVCVNSRLKSLIMPAEEMKEGRAEGNQEEKIWGVWSLLDPPLPWRMLVFTIGGGLNNWSQIEGCINSAFIFYSSKPKGVHPQDLRPAGPTALRAVCARVCVHEYSRIPVHPKPRDFHPSFFYFSFLLRSL